MAQVDTPFDLKDAPQLLARAPVGDLPLVNATQKLTTATVGENTEQRMLSFIRRMGLVATVVVALVAAANSWAVAPKAKSSTAATQSSVVAPASQLDKSSH